ncbi:hypothetical protein HDZ31DRAFT_47630 [Schizophyllum fasciatum]
MEPKADISLHVRNAFKCPISGSTDDLRVCYPIPLDTANGSEEEVSRMEWVFGLPRGGLWYWLRSKENAVYFRKDLCEMYCRGEFVLASTFQECLRVQDFMRSAGIKNRLDNDRTPRRPLSALARPDGLYRYVVIPSTDAARALLKEFPMQRQTDEDLNWGAVPSSLNKTCIAGSADLPVIECYAHPYAVATFANDALDISSTFLSGQWHMTSYNIISEWLFTNRTPVPQWFLDEPKYSCDDSDLSATEATGYDPSALNSEDSVTPATILRDPSIDDDDYRKKVCHWFTKIDPKAKPTREAFRAPVKPRRSKRIQAMLGEFPSPSSDEEGIPLSPVRRGPLRPRNPVRHPPAWTRFNGGYPTRRFTSNDWAYFRYHVALMGSVTDVSPRAHSVHSRTT